jgi:hypothetical protein
MALNTALHPRQIGSRREAYFAHIAVALRAADPARSMRLMRKMQVRLGHPHTRDTICVAAFMASAALAGGRS